MARTGHWGGGVDTDAGVGTGMLHTAPHQTKATQSKAHTLLLLLLVSDPASYNTHRAASRPLSPHTRPAPKPHPCTRTANAPPSQPSLTTPTQPSPPARQSPLPPR